METPNTLMTIPMSSGLRSNSIACPTMAKAPWRIPAAPRPAFAQPTVEVEELGAAAQTMELTEGF